MPKKPQKDEMERIYMRAPADWVERVETWRGKRRPIPNFSDAVRTLTDLGITVSRKSVETELKKRERKK